MRQAQADKHSSVPAIPVTVRQLEAVIRISESIARMQLLPVATQEHVAKAIQLFNFSTMEAVKSGLHDNLVRLPTQTGILDMPQPEHGPQARAWSSEDTKLGLTPVF